MNASMNPTHSGAVNRLPHRSSEPAIWDQTQSRYCPARSPVDAWLELEDLCWRLRHAGVALHFGNGQLRLVGFKVARLPRDLRSAIENTDTYGWWVDSDTLKPAAHSWMECGSVVATLHTEGIDLVLTLPSPSLVSRFPACDELMLLHAAFVIAMSHRGLS
ncbi:hypothetical protein [Inhella gelatinilytica]|uniref:Uncharacterized protein n=1 Tax=Inhella gelatinilytica TaxID=2795030 RepID=A0A931IYL2_9BURK|nr:hypothetical protein [Inhella gelatinilytica]MBH9553991.1 hypothetical protein [Inhella gelatinilytica]